MNKKTYRLLPLLVLILLSSCAKGIDRAEPVSKEKVNTEDNNKDNSGKNPPKIEEENSEKTPEELFQAMEELKELAKEAQDLYEKKNLEGANEKLTRIYELVEKDVFVTIEEGRILNNLGLAATEAEDEENAKKIFSYANKVFQITQQNLVSQLNINLSNLSTLAHQEGHDEAAEEYLLDSLIMLQVVLGNEHPLTTSCQVDLGDFYIKVNNLDKAEEVFRSLLDSLKDKEGAKDSSIVILRKLKGVYEKKEDKEKVKEIEKEINALQSVE